MGRRSRLIWWRRCVSVRRAAQPGFVRESQELHGWGVGDVGDGLVKVVLAMPKPLVDDLERYLADPPELTAAKLAPIGYYGREALVGLDPEPVAARHCLNVFSPDGDLVLGAHPHDPRVVVAGPGRAIASSTLRRSGTSSPTSC
jgi:hypothetical protein